MKTSVLCKCVLALLLVSASARAVDDPDTENAKKHFQAGVALYTAKDYRKALTEFNAARELRDLPEFLYNIARCHDRLEEWTKALDVYQDYLWGAMAPGKVIKRAELEEVGERIAVLRKRVNQQAKKQVQELDNLFPARTNPPSDEHLDVQLAPLPPVPWRRYAPAIGVGAGALALLATGLAVYVSVGPDLDDLHARRNACGACDLTADIDSLKSRENAGYAILAIGGATAVTAAILAVLYARRILPRESRHVWLAPAPGGLTLAF